MAADPFYVNASNALVLPDVAPLLVVNGASAILEDSSIIQESDSGLVTVIERWPRRRRSWRISWNYLAAVEIERLFYVNGRKYTFLFIPPRERHYSLLGHAFAIGNGVDRDFQLAQAEPTVGTIGFPHAQIRAPEQFNIYYPIEDDFLDIQVDGISVAFTLGGRGMVSLYNIPPADSYITAYCHFATPVRFQSETLEMSMQDTDIDQIMSATIVEDFE